MFPFEFQGKQYNECKWECDNGGFYWCSTKTDDHGAHQRGHWGKCNPGCPLEPSKDRFLIYADLVNLKLQVVHCFQIFLHTKLFP